MQDVYILSKLPFLTPIILPLRRRRSRSMALRMLLPSRRSPIPSGRGRIIRQ